MRAPSPSKRFLEASILLSLVGWVVNSCLLVSDWELENRVETAVPFGTQVSINESEVTILCVAASFELSNTGNFLDQRNKDMNPLRHGLGGVWQKSPSMLEFMKSIRDPHVETMLSRALHASKTCMKQLGIAHDFLWKDPIFATRSNSGSEVILVFQSSGKDGWYFAQGR